MFKALILGGLGLSATLAGPCKSILADGTCDGGLSREAKMVIVDNFW